MLCVGYFVDLLSLILTLLMLGWFVSLALGILVMTGYLVCPYLRLFRCVWCLWWLVCCFNFVAYVWVWVLLLTLVCCLGFCFCLTNRGQLVCCMILLFCAMDNGVFAAFWMAVYG